MDSPRHASARLDEAVELYKEDFIYFIIVSGAVGKEGFDEAEIMKEYLIKQGIPQHLVYLDNQGSNTRQTALNSIAIMKSQNWTSVVLVSQYFHLARAKLAFSRIGAEKVTATSSSYFELRDFYSIFREIAAYCSYFFSL